MYTPSWLVVSVCLTAFLVPRDQELALVDPIVVADAGTWLGFLLWRSVSVYVCGG